MDILKWECLLEVELRVASYEHREKAQKYFSCLYVLLGRKMKPSR